MLRLAIAVLLLTSLVAQAAPRPNVILIMADDLGCFELGCYGQKKIRTPHLDKLAKSGVQFNRFYSGNAVCAPSRCCLMTGKHPGHAAVRDNREQKPEGQFPLPASEITLTELLKKQGYATALMGKWGLGPFGSSGDPMKRGFDLFYGYNCQRHAHSHYPTYLYRNSERFELPGNNGLTGTQYTHDLFEKEALQFIQDQKEKPFLLYLPFIVPHVAVQVPEDSLNEYRGKLGDDPAYDGKKGYRVHPAPHAAYAAMVTRLDRTVGRIVEQLQKLKLDENTIIFFTSDNGPTHNVGGADSTFFESAGKLRGLKGSLYEGGIRVPMLVSWPGTIKPNQTCEKPFALWDLLPTICDVTGTPTPIGIDGISLAKGLNGDAAFPDHELLYWEFPGYGGQQAIQVGEWKAMRQGLGKKSIKTELYHLKSDESESKDVAATNPEVVNKLEELMRREHTSSKEFPLQSIDAKK